MNCLVTNSADYAYYDDSNKKTIIRYADDGATWVATTYYTKSDGVTIGYDGMGRLTDMQQFFDSTDFQYSWQYDLASRVIHETMPLDTVDMTGGYDAANQLIAATHTDTNFINEAFTYDSNGKPKDFNQIDFLAPPTPFDGLDEGLPYSTLQTYAIQDLASDGRV
jgi:YD repeat-containing protein